MTKLDERHVPPSGVFGIIVNILWPAMGFVGGAMVGLIGVAVILVVIFLFLSGRDEGPAPFINLSAPSVQAGGLKGDGEVRVVESDSQRLLQRCRGACDEITR